MHPEMEGVRHKLVQMLVIKLRDACNPVSAESGKAIDKLNFFMEALEETEDRARTKLMSERFCASSTSNKPINSYISL